MKNVQNASKESVLKRLNRTLRTDCYITPFDIIARRLVRLRPAARRELLVLCDEALACPRLRTRDAVRVASAKVMVALLPDSLKTIESWLKKKEPRSVFEVHFSFFCYLDEVSASSRSDSLRTSVLKLVEGYLRTTRSDAAQAAWMAGDLLGDHWDLSESLSVLLELAGGAQHAAGRTGGVHGLEEAFGRCKREDVCREIRNALERASKIDPCREVRLAAKIALDRITSSKPP